MQLRSLDRLDFDLAWRRVLFRMRRFIDVPDRLPYEVVNRVTNGSPRLDHDHYLRPINLVMATKGSGTVRPFVRLSPIDMLLYQALVDALAPEIEAALGHRDRVFAFRLNLEGAENAFQGSPSWTDFMGAVRDRLEEEQRAYVLTIDVANFFIHVDTDELERRLLEVGGRSDVVRDLGQVLRGWRQFGVRGLPQGVPPSSALGNLYLSKLDRALDEWGAEYWRYMDDTWILAESYSAARAIQDRIERLLYDDGLGLGGEKLKIRRATTALNDTETAAQRIQQRREALLEEVLAAADDPYLSDETEFEFDEQEIDEAAVHEEYDELLEALASDRIPADARSRLTEVYRELEKARDPYALEEIPQILLRLPDLTGIAVRYLAKAKAADANQAIAALLEVTKPGRFHRDQEWLHICRAAMWLRPRPSLETAARMDEVARQHEHPLIQARALLAWGAQSAPDDFSLADEFWPTAAASWRPYVLMSIQKKDEAGRDERYERWSGEERFLRSVADEIRAKQFPWQSL
jgi:hypothetical protein